MLNLLAKDFKLIFTSGKNRKQMILSICFTILAFGLVIAIETFMFSSILQKIKDYKNAPIAFFTLFLFIIQILMIILCVFNAKKLLFNEEDIKQLSKYPIETSEIIISKLIILFLTQYVTSLMFTYPLFISYGVIASKPIWFYYLALFYPVLGFIFEAGVALLLVYPYKLLIDFLKKHLILQFVVSILVIGVLSYFYGIVLNVFVKLVSTNNINSILSVDSIKSLVDNSKYFFPTNFLADLLLKKSPNTTIFPYLAISGGVLIFGLLVGITFFNYFKNLVVYSKPNHKVKEPQIRSVTKALFKKELILIFKDSSYLLTFTGLLSIQPFLLYIVIEAINTIFTSGVFSFYISILPNFILLLDMLIVMLFTLVINSGASTYIEAEDKNIRLMKSLPISPFKQIFIKFIIPFGLSFISLFVSMIVLLIFDIFTFSAFIFCLLLSTILLFIFDIISLREELKIKRDKPRSTLVSSIYSYLLPIFYFIVTVVASYFGLSIYISYIFGLLVFVLLSLPFFINIKRKISEDFMDLEVAN